MADNGRQTVDDARWETRATTNTMASLFTLPVELKMIIITFIRDTDNRDDGRPQMSNIYTLDSLARTCRLFYVVVNPVLYAAGLRRHPYLLTWAADVSNHGTMKRLLEVGANPNIATRFEDRVSWPRCNELSRVELFRCQYARGFKPFDTQDIFSSSPAGYDDHDIVKGRSSSLKTDYFYLLRHNKHSWALDWKIYEGEESGLQKLLSDKGRDDLRMPVHMAAQNGDLEAFELLLRYGAIIQVPSIAWSDMLWTSLHYALLKGSKDFAKLVLHISPASRERMASGSGPNCESVMPIFISAIRHGRFELAEYILTEGINDVHRDYGCPDQRRYGTLLWWAYWEHQLEEALPILLRNGADIDVDIGDGHTLLVETCAKGCYEYAALLVRSGADTNVVFRRPALHSNMREGTSNPDMFLRDRDQDDSGRTVSGLHGDLEDGTTGNCPLLGLRPMQILCQPAIYSTHLTHEGRRMDDEITAPIHLNNVMGAFLDHMDDIEGHPLCLAAFYHENEVAAHLLGNGRHPDTPDDNGRTPLYFAIKGIHEVDGSDRPCEYYYFIETVRLLCNHFIQWKTTPSDGGTAVLSLCKLMLFQDDDKSDAVIELVKCGVDPNLRDGKKRSLLMIAFEMGLLPAARDLVALGAKLGKASDYDYDGDVRPRYDFDAEHDVSWDDEQQGSPSPPPLERDYCQSDYSTETWNGGEEGYGYYHPSERALRAGVDRKMLKVENDAEDGDLKLLWLQFLYCVCPGTNRFYYCKDSFQFLAEVAPRLVTDPYFREMALRSGRNQAVRWIDAWANSRWEDDAYMRMMTLRDRDNEG
ncbi:Tankyrase-1 [Colletotrichum sidae]|uniref:Tankyrase-1 n=1 Tax=Colletotrichum sidae TaxID=1347389 RepID=A0A4R8TKE6_9PEZI|nr:Tankyrase-1 [Colletotrichum sidae]